MISDTQTPRTRVESVVGVIDWEKLRSQKLELLILRDAPSLSDDSKGALSGIIHLLDAIQDAAADDLGNLVVFGEAFEGDDSTEERT